MKDGYLRMETATYSVEIPKGWTMGAETPWGARDIKPGEGGGQMGTMTAGPSPATWEQLYRTSLSFILREKAGKPTPYRVSKAKQGYESCSFAVVSEDGFTDRRYTLLKAPSGKVLALSVKIPEKKAEKAFLKSFERMVATAKIVD